MINQTFLVQDDRRVDLWQAGEGQSGDFDPNDPNDIEFLRFDVQERKDGEWETMDDASYCTQLPVDSDFVTIQKALRWIMQETYGKTEIKKICEELSWISPQWFVEPRLSRF